MLGLLYGLWCSAAVATAPPSSFARLQNDSTGRWWVVQDGKETLALGITAITYDNFVDGRTGISIYKQTNDKRFGANRTAWAEDSLKLLRKHGFNTVGPWSDNEMNEAASRAASNASTSFYTPILGIGWAATDWTQGQYFPDVFSEAFGGNATRIAQTMVAPFQQDRALLGWYFDNELPWWRVESGDAEASPTCATNLLWQFLTVLPPNAPGHGAAKAYLAKRLSMSLNESSSHKRRLVSILNARGSVIDFTNLELRHALQETLVEYESEFALSVSHTYHSIITSAIRKVDPNHLLLGAKFTGLDSGTNPGQCNSFDAVLEGARGFVDAHSIDVYAFTPGRDMLQHYYAVTGVPWILAECLGFRSVINLSKDPNRLGAGPVVPTQTARAEAWTVFARKALAIPFLIGLNHFTWVDEPSGGRGVGGEDSNYGLVSLYGTEYVELEQAMLQVMPQALAIHRGGRKAARCTADTADFYSGFQGHLRSMVSPIAGNQGPDGAADLCLTAQDSGIVIAAACTAPDVHDRQDWVVLTVGGFTGHRLQNVHTHGCLNIWFSSESNAQLRSDGNCSEPSNWHWPPAWEHDGDCSLMQYCGYPPGWAQTNVCYYDQSCASVTSIKQDGGDVGAGAAFLVHATPCVATALEQQFAFVHSDAGASAEAQTFI